LFIIIIGFNISWTMANIHYRRHHCAAVLLCVYIVNSMIGNETMAYSIVIRELYNYAKKELTVATSKIM